MRILTVCRMNQARSVFSQRVLSQLFPELEIFSAGVEVSRSMPPLLSTNMISHDWGLPSASGGSIKVEDYGRQSFDLVIVAEDWMKARVTCDFSRIVSYDEIAFLEDFLPMDPEKLELKSFQIELAKVFWVSTRATNDLTHFVNPRISAVIPEHESLIPKALEFATSFARSIDAYLVDAEVRRTYNLELKELGLAPYENEYPLLAPSADRYVSLTSFQGNPGNYFINSNFYKRLFDLAKVAPVVMVTSPIHSFDGSIYDPFLASAIADDIRVIRQF